MSEKVVSHTGQEHFPRNLRPFCLDGAQAFQRPFFHGVVPSPEFTSPEQQGFSQQLSPRYIFGFVLLLQEWF